MFVGWPSVAARRCALDGREELFRAFFEQWGEKIEQSISDEELVLHVFQIFWGSWSCRTGW